MGESKYISHQRYDFDLTNPNGRSAPGPYDSLTDPSLKDYFNSPRTRQHLVDNGLVTDRGEIKCNIKEFNEYRYSHVIEKYNARIFVAVNTGTFFGGSYRYVVLSGNNIMRCQYRHIIWTTDKSIPLF